MAKFICEPYSIHKVSSSHKTIKSPLQVPLKNHYLVTSLRDSGPVETSPVTADMWWNRPTAKVNTDRVG
ncbi:hypothetical protein J6590_019523 [Homalodisca vitripennis]|nr:hypothetical protein J6590_019523 [Homalodisca vitripennis]